LVGDKVVGRIGGAKVALLIRVNLDKENSYKRKERLSLYKKERKR
jgi:hypothetical protein